MRRRKEEGIGRNVRAWLVDGYLCSGREHQRLMIGEITWHWSLLFKKNKHSHKKMNRIPGG
jgi:hypothetical protein